MRRPAPCLPVLIALLLFGACTTEEPVRAPSQPAKARYLTTIAALEREAYERRGSAGEDGLALLLSAPGGEALSEGATHDPSQPLLAPDDLVRAAEADCWRGPRDQELEMFPVFEGLRALLVRAEERRLAGALVESETDVRAAWRSAAHMERYGSLMAAMMGSVIRERAAEELAALRKAAGRPGLGTEWLGPAPLSARSIIEARRLMDQRRALRAVVAGHLTPEGYESQEGRNDKWTQSLLAALEGGPAALQEARTEICGSQWQWGEHLRRAVSASLNALGGRAAYERWVFALDADDFSAGLFKHLESRDRRLRRAASLLGTSYRSAGWKACG